MENTKKPYHSPYCESISMDCELFISGSAEQSPSDPAAHDMCSDGAQMSNQKRGIWKNQLWGEE